MNDPRRARTPISETDRSMASEMVKRHYAEGLLSSREADEKLEQVFRARTRTELDLVLSGLSRPAHVVADMVSVHGIAPTYSPKKARPFWQVPALIALGGIVLWLLVWIVTGGSVVWLVLTVLMTLAAFAFRLGRSYRRELGLPSGGRGASRSRRSLM